MSHSSVLVVEDEPSLRAALCDTLDLAGYTVEMAGNGNEALDVLSREEIAMVISDVQMKPMDGNILLDKIRKKNPEIPVLLMTAYGSIQKAVEAMQRGAVDYLVKPFEAEILVNMVDRYIREDAHGGDMVIADEVTRNIASLARRVSDSDVTVMITGESGTGKEVLARYLHVHSGRANGPFVAINCAAIPDNMLEATLFGYEKGAFTGAYQACPGKFEQAQGGTLLLDEISEMDLGLQAKLLRVLQEREVERLGGRKTIELDVRILATSNRELRKEVQEKRFREDLYYRLNVFPLHLPPLRERRGDILPLAERLLTLNTLDGGQPVPELSADARDKLLAYNWPGNIRELENVIKRSLILGSGQVVDADAIQFAAEECLHDEGSFSSSAQEQAGPGADKLGEDLRSREQNIILEALRAAGGVRKKAAETLGISQRTLRYKIARMREEGIAVPGR